MTFWDFADKHADLIFFAFIVAAVTAGSVCRAWVQRNR